jgi:hypothetical protein
MTWENAWFENYVPGTDLAVLLATGLLLVWWFALLVVF